MPKPSTLWRLESSSNPTSYLFGTMHVRDKSAYSHIEKALQAMEFCTNLRCEIDLDKAKSEILPEDYLIPDGMTISSLVGQNKFERMRSIISKSFQMDLLNLNRFYPILAINQMSEAILSEDHRFALDHFLWQKAKEKNLITGGIETISSQIMTLQTLDLSSQIKMLQEVTRNVSRFRKSINSLVTLYEQERIFEIYKMSKKSMGSLRDLLIYRRNKNMAEYIISNFSEPCFYAVGAAHLGGNKGVLAILKRNNIKLSPSH